MLPVSYLWDVKPEYLMIEAWELRQYFQQLLGKLILHACDDILPVNCNMIISILSTLFMPQSKCVEKLMKDNTMMKTAWPKRQQLEVSLESNTAVAAVSRKNINKIRLGASFYEPFHGELMSRRICL